MTPEDLRTYVALGREESGIEFKGSMPRSDWLFFARVMRAALGMSNRRDGGYIVIGVEEAEGKLSLGGLTDENLATWVYDQVADGIAQYADPNVVFNLQTVELDGKKFVVLRVEEFDEVPILCRKTYQTKGGEVVLREGACYVRPRRKPETIEVSSYPDMRDLIDLATDKSVRRFVQRANAADMAIGERAVAAPEAEFSRQRSDFQ